MSQEKAVVLSSGGLNSAVATAMAVREYQAALLHVRFGHRAAEREEELFNQQADHFEVRDRLTIDMPHFTAIGGNARVSRKRQIEDALAIGDRESICYVAGLIGSLVQAAFTWAHQIGAGTIVIGVSENLGPPAPRTADMYPDFSREYLQLCHHLLAVASPRKPVAFSAPLADLSRTDIVKLGQRLNVPFDMTWSCLSSGTEPCGACVGCATRARGFLNAGIADPILLQHAHY